MVGGTIVDFFACARMFDLRLSFNARCALHCLGMASLAWHRSIVTAPALNCRTCAVAAPRAAQVSRISRESINALKAHFADEMTKDDWRLVVKLKKTFQIA